MDKIREQFEDKFRKDYGEEYLTTDDDGEYINWITADLWEFWQASRAAVEVELPKYHDYTDQDTTRSQAEKSAYNSGVYDSFNAICAAGLGVKEV